MALCKDRDKIKPSEDPAFDVSHQPGAAAPHSGIYRCANCGDEVASNATQPLPPQNHQQHNPQNGPIRWKLLVYAVQKQ